MERKYVLTRVRKGDYLLPSNDLKTLWRIYSYEEEGSLIEELPGGEERPVLGTFWACSRRPMPDTNTLMDEDFLYDGWEHWAGPLNTRTAAIEEALRAGEVAAMREP